MGSFTDSSLFFKPQNLPINSNRQVPNPDSQFVSQGGKGGTADRGTGTRRGNDDAFSNANGT